MCSLALACALTASGCSAPASGYSAGTRSEAVEQADVPATVAAVEDVRQGAVPQPVPGIASHAISRRGSSEDAVLRYPSVTGYPAFNERVLTDAQSYVGARQRDSDQRSGASELRGSWQLLAASGPVVGVRNVVVSGTREEGDGLIKGPILAPGKAPEVSDADIYTLWVTGPDQAPVMGVELISPERRGELLRLVQDTLKESDYRTHAATLPPLWGEDIDGSADTGADNGAAAAKPSEYVALRAISFTPEGSLQVWLPAGLLTPLGHGDLVVTLAGRTGDEYLSEMGRIAQNASAAGAPAFASLGAAAPRQGHVDCAVAQCVALTFDDGPGDYTSELLDTLWERGVPATFFLIGYKAERRPDLVRRMVAEGSEVADHTRTHPQLPRLSARQQSAQVEGAADQIEAAGGYRPTLLRPPYGEFNAATRRLGWPLIMWDVDTLDWKTQSTEATVTAALDEAEPGSIILMHDIHAPTVAAVPAIVDGLLARGYTLVTVSDLYGGEFQPGAKYFSQHEVY